ncbi:MAG: SAM-dependent methyltransferase [Bacteroidia bacterium]
MQYGNLYLFPVPLGDTTIKQVIPADNLDILLTISEFIAEDIRSARRHLKQMGIRLPLETLVIHEIGKHSDKLAYDSFLNAALQGKHVGLLSEAGCPGIADPGALIVQKALQKNIKVVPLSGPSSLLLALMASGSNGQSFCFHGYLPIDKGERFRKLKEIELIARTKNQTQLFIEAPFRNDRLFDDILTECKSDTEICIACDLTLPTEYIRRKTIQAWKKEKPSFHKRPAVFIICC